MACGHQHTEPGEESQLIVRFKCQDGFESGACGFPVATPGEGQGDEGLDVAVVGIFLEEVFELLLRGLKSSELHEPSGFEPASREVSGIVACDGVRLGECLGQSTLRRIELCAQHPPFDGVRVAGQGVVDFGESAVPIAICDGVSGDIERIGGWTLRGMQPGPEEEDREQGRAPS